MRTTITPASQSAARCVACGSSSEPRRKHLITGLTITSCRRCDFVIGESSIEEGLKQYGDIDVANYMGSLGVMRLEEAISHVQMVMHSSPPLFNWLDVGCGIGSVLVKAKADGFTVLGIEPDPTAKRIAIEATGAPILDKFNDNTITNNSQGVISMLDFLEHVAPSDLEATANLVRRKLVNDGLWLIKVPSTDGLFYMAANAAAALIPSLVADIINRLWMANYEFPHRVYFNERNLRTFLKRHGFGIAAVRYTAAMPTGTILKRLRMNKTLSPAKAMLVAPIAFVMNLVETARKRSDSLVVLARKNDSPTG